MTLEPLPGFQSLQTHHCVTGSMRHIYLYNQHDISEEMLLGIGAGVSFSYWHFKGQAPFMGGRGNVGMPSQEGLEKTAGRRTGVVVEKHHTGSAKKAEEALLGMLAEGKPVMLTLDMGFLPYFDFGGEEYHFGAHAVVACGHDLSSREVLVADRDGLHPVPMATLAQARGSKHRPFPPRNQWHTFDFSEKRQPTAGEVCQAILEQAVPMLEPPISNIGVKGIRKAGQAVPRWGESMAGEELRWALVNSYIMLTAAGGTGGGAFRAMFSRFLDEAVGITGDARFADSAAEFRRIGDAWEALGEWFRRTSEAPDPASHLGECAGFFHDVAEQEQAAWTRLRELAD
ncbi:MAG: BtrH N-terminal domain-containing protein [Anaerolineaceae bacterium]|nr:BtrH N-terminal domain-containing protein [Anaerolineaceae bacterium]